MFFFFKSYDIIEHLYRHIDPNARFVYEPGNIKTIPEGSNVVILDDCVGSGGSVITIAETLKKANRGFNINSASIFSTTEGQARINAEGIRTISANSKTRLTDSPFFKGLEPEDQTLLLLTLDGNKILMPDYHGSDRLAILFPWMSPNNNSLCFAAVTSEIALCPNQAIKNLPWVMDPTPSQSMGGLIGLHDLSTMLNKKVNFETLTQLNTICDGKLFNEKFTVHYFMSLENPTLKYILPGLDLDKLRGLITEEGANEFWNKLLIPNK